MSELDSDLASIDFEQIRWSLDLFDLREVDDRLQHCPQFDLHLSNLMKTIGHFLTFLASKDSIFVIRSFPLITALKKINYVTESYLSAMNIVDNLVESKVCESNKVMEGFECNFQSDNDYNFHFINLFLQRYLETGGSRFFHHMFTFMEWLNSRVQLLQAAETYADQSEIKRMQISELNQNLRDYNYAKRIKSLLTDSDSLGRSSLILIDLNSVTFVVDECDKCIEMYSAILKTFVHNELEYWRKFPNEFASVRRILEKSKFLCEIQKCDELFSEFIEPFYALLSNSTKSVEIQFEEALFNKQPPDNCVDDLVKSFNLFSDFIQIELLKSQQVRELLTSFRSSLSEKICRCYSELATEVHENSQSLVDISNRSNRLNLLEGFDPFIRDVNFGELRKKCDTDIISLYSSFDNLLSKDLFDEAFNALDHFVGEERSKREKDLERKMTQWIERVERM